MPLTFVNELNFFCSNIPQYTAHDLKIDARSSEIVLLVSVQPNLATSRDTPEPTVRGVDFPCSDFADNLRANVQDYRSDTSHTISERYLGRKSEGHAYKSRMRGQFTDTIWLLSRYAG